MKQIIKLRWAVIAAWIVGAVLFTVFTPNLQQLVAEKGQITVPDEYRSVQANQLLEKMSKEDAKTHDLVLVFHEENGLTAEDKAEIGRVIDELTKAKETLEIKDILNFAENEDIAKSTVSEDNTTIMVPIIAATEKQSITDLRETITNLADEITVPHALTGESLIEEDIIINSEEGLTKTVYITVALILVILFAVFRSFIAPIIPLLTVGISYLVAEGIVSILADTTNFPLSTFTQIFMVSIMFGIGTDYCILIISRFKEEMNQHESMKDAVIATYKASGKTVFYAALAVLIGFSTIGLSQFSLYKSAVAVAVGVFVITIALLTIVPFFLVVLGKKLFWPFDKSAEHKESKLWGALGHFTWTRPILSIAIILIVTLPALLLYKGEQTYDNLAELNDGFDTVKGFSWIEKGFGPGEIMPVTVVMELNEEIEDVDDFQGIENITKELADMDGIAKVRSATRPAGDIIEDFLLEQQTGILTDGLDEIVDGVNELNSGLKEAADEMQTQAPELSEAQDGVQQLMDGTNEAREGILEVKKYLTEIEDGIRSGALGVDEVISGLQSIKNNLDETIQGHKDILAGYRQLEDGLRQAQEQIASMTDFDFDLDPEEVIQGVNVLEESFSELNELILERDPEIAEDPNYQEAFGTAQYIIGEIKETLDDAGNQLADIENIDVAFEEQIIGPLKQLNDGYSDTIQGQEQLASGLQDLINGIGALRDGLHEAANGQGEIADNMNPLADGLSEIRDGQGQFKTAFAELQDGLTELADGLTEGSDGLAEINDGLVEMNRFLNEMDFSNQEAIVVIPKEALEEAEFWEAADMYFSADRHIIKFEAVLDIHPYSREALHLVDDVDKEVEHAIEKTNLDVANYKIAGISSMNNDLYTVSAKDYKRTATLMLIGIFIILVFLLRSIVMPIYILASLLLTYYTALGFTELIFVHIAGQDGLTWAIPFFSFVMLIALGVDYSIFLMSRFNEYKDKALYEGMTKSMRNMGTVIISATIILGGTFGAMLPSGVLSLLQIASLVIIGLALYALIILPLFTPIFVKLFGKYNWWPFEKRE